MSFRITGVKIGGRQELSKGFLPLILLAQIQALPGMHDRIFRAETDGDLILFPRLLRQAN